MIKDQVCKGSYRFQFKFIRPFAVGINKFSIHGFAHQANEDVPGNTFGPYGVFWNRKQTFWPRVGDYHEYLARCSHLLQQGVTVSDIMTPTLFNVYEDTPVQVIADHMVRGRIHREFVTRGDRVVGIITAMDLLKIVSDLPLPT